MSVEVRITERKTGRVISHNWWDNHFTEEDKGFAQVCWWGLRSFWELGYELAEICEKHTKTKFNFLENYEYEFRLT